MGVNSLPKTVTRQRRDCELNPGPSAPESSTLTTRLYRATPSFKYPSIIPTLLYHRGRETAVNRQNLVRPTSEQPDPRLPAANLRVGRNSPPPLSRTYCPRRQFSNADWYRLGPASRPGGSFGPLRSSVGRLL